MSAGLTPAMSACLRAIQDMTIQGVPPSYADLQERLGLASRGGVHRILSQLRERGHVDWDYGHARSLRLTNPFAGKSTEELQTMRRQIDRLLRERGS